MEKIKMGKVVNAVGLKGEVKVYNYSDSIDIYEDASAVYLDDKPMEVESVKRQKNMVILKLSGIGDRDEAEAAKGKCLYVAEDQLPELPQGQYYVKDIIGMDVLEDGARLGTVTDVIQNTAQDVLEVERECGKKLLIPYVDRFILDIDAEERKIRVKLIEGMLDL